jgi:hypothetical protein
VIRCRVQVLRLCVPVSIQALLDTVLLALLPQNKTENSASYALGQRFIARCFTSLQMPVSNFVHEV